eukprot:8922540-Pyramimonas_sp.AAC.1
MKDVRFFVDEAVLRIPCNVTHVLHLAGDNACWKLGGRGIYPGTLWNDISALLRAEKNRRIEQCRAENKFSKIAMLDGAALAEKSKHPARDNYHAYESGDPYANEKGFPHEGFRRVCGMYSEDDE